MFIGPSLFQEPVVSLRHLLSFIERASTLLFKAPEVCLRVSQVELKVLTYEVRVELRRVRITWNKGGVRCDTGGRGGRRVENNCEYYSEDPTRTPQADATESPYFLDHLHTGSLSVV